MLNINSKYLYFYVPWVVVVKRTFLIKTGGPLAGVSMFFKSFLLIYSHRSQGGQIYSCEQMSFPFSRSLNLLDGIASLTRQGNLQFWSQNGLIEIRVWSITKKFFLAIGLIVMSPCLLKLKKMAMTTLVNTRIKTLFLQATKCVQIFFFKCKMDEMKLLIPELIG